MKQKINIGGKIILTRGSLRETQVEMRKLEKEGKLNVRIKDAEIVRKYLLNREERRKEREKEEALIQKKKIRDEYMMLKKKIYEKIHNEKFFAKKYDEYKENDFKRFLELYSLIYNVRIIEEVDFDEKGRGFFTKVNVWGYGNGYAFIEHFCYLQWKTKEHSTKRRNWFMLGFTEEGRIFIKSISNMRRSTMRDLIFAENIDIARKIVWKFLTGYTITGRDITQGDLLLKYISKLKEIEKISDEEKEYKLRNHILRGNFIIEDKEDKEDKAYVKNAYLVHRQHNVKLVPRGIYKIVFQKDYYLWDFSEVKSD